MGNSRIGNVLPRTEFFDLALDGLCSQQLERSLIAVVVFSHGTDGECKRQFREQRIDENVLAPPKKSLEAVDFFAHIAAKSFNLVIADCNGVGLEVRPYDPAFKRALDELKYEANPEVIARSALPGLGFLSAVTNKYEIIERFGKFTGPERRRSHTLLAAKDRRDPPATIFYGNISEQTCRRTERCRDQGR